MRLMSPLLYQLSYTAIASKKAGGRRCVYTIRVRIP